MKILTERPPDWIMDGCLSQFRVNVEHTYWTYGDTIYNPGGDPLPDHLIVHESTHMRQQAAYEGGPDAWWKRFLEDPEFRYSQELEAYAVQHAFFCKTNKDRNKQFQFALSLARALSGPLYQLPVTLIECQKEIRDLSATVVLP